MKENNSKGKKTIKNENEIKNETNEKVEENINNDSENANPNEEKKDYDSKKDNQLLISIYQNCNTGVASIVELLPSVKNGNLKQELCEQINEYEKIITNALKIANNKNMALKPNNWFEKFRLWCSIKMSTLTNKDTRHLSELLIVGTVMGLIQCYKDAKDFENCSSQNLLLLKKLTNLQENAYNNFKKYL